MEKKSDVSSITPMWTLWGSKEIRTKLEECQLTYRRILIKSYQKSKVARIKKLSFFLSSGTAQIPCMHSEKSSTKSV